MHILWVSDLHFTGYATQAKRTLKAIHENYPTITISGLAINHGEPDKKKLEKQIRDDMPFIKYVFVIDALHTTGITVLDGDSAYGQLLGVYELCRVGRCNDAYKIDTVIIMNDNLAFRYKPAKKVFPDAKFICYMPVDSADIPDHYMDDLSWFDVVLTMNRMSLLECKKGLKDYSGVLDYVYPLTADTDTDDKTYKKLSASKNELRAKWGLPVDKFIVYNINMNQERKRFDITIRGFFAFNKHHPNSYLVLKTNAFMELNIENYVKALGEDFNLVKVFNQIYTPDELNELYNLVDVTISTSMAEGWGYTPVEAILAECPTIVPDHTSFREIFPFHNRIKCTPISWYLKKDGVYGKVPEINPTSLIDVARISRKLSETSITKTAEGLTASINTPSFIITNAGRDEYNQPLAQLTAGEVKVPILGNYRTLDFARKAIKAVLDKTDLNCMYLRIEAGNKMEFFREIIGSCHHTLILEEFDVTELYLPAVQITNYIPDVADLVTKLHLLYSMNDRSRYNQGVKEWLLKNCNGKAVSEKFMSFLK